MSQMKKVVPFISLNCGDPKLHAFIKVLDNAELHRERRLGGACLFRVNPTALLEFATIATSFGHTRFKHALILSHTGCVAIAENGYFANLKEKRDTFPPDLDGDIEFNKRVLGKVKMQADNLPFDIQWHFGVVLTHLAERLSADDDLEHVINNVVIWPFGQPPKELFREKIERVLIDPHHTGPFTGLNGHNAQPHEEHHRV